MHAQWHGPEAVVKEEQSLVFLDAQEVRHVRVVGESGRQANQADELMSAIPLAEGSCDDALQYCTTVIMEQVNFILNVEKKKKTWPEDIHWESLLACLIPCTQKVPHWLFVCFVNLASIFF